MGTNGVLELKSSQSSAAKANYFLKWEVLCIVSKTCAVQSQKK